MLAPAPAVPLAALAAPAGLAPGPAVTYVWVAVECTGGRNRGDVVCIEPAALAVGHVRLGETGDCS